MGVDVVDQRFCHRDGGGTDVCIYCGVFSDVLIEGFFVEQFVDEAESEGFGGGVFETLSKQFKALFFTEISTQNRRHHRGNKSYLYFGIPEPSSICRDY